MKVDSIGEEDYLFWTRIW